MRMKPPTILNRPLRPALVAVKPKGEATTLKARAYHYLITSTGVNPSLAKKILGLAEVPN